MVKYIKSHSNFVLKKKHQTVNDGTIYERDITTIGGVDSFSPNETVQYKSGNFIITVNDDNSFSKKYSSGEWAENTFGGNVWTKDTLEKVNDASDNTSRIVLKQDVYKLTNFAYYGSCVELIRGALNNIINRFPAELYSPRGVNDRTGELMRTKGIEVYYEETNKPEIVDGDVVGNLASPKTVRLTPQAVGEDFKGEWYLLDNPFDIDIYTPNAVANDIINPLRSFAYENYKKYEVYDSMHGKVYDKITQWEVKLYDPCELDVSPRLVAKITFSAENTDDNSIYDKNTIVVMQGDGRKPVYLVPRGMQDIHIRPKAEYIDEFFNGLSNFEKVILNRYSKPLYKSVFEVMDEDENGFVSSLEEFIFPLASGGYNIDIHSSLYDKYVTKLYLVAEFYDEYFCDNMWRSMTHEAIKNFDWTYGREKENSQLEGYIEGGNKMQKLIRLFGKEFDSIKEYIDAIPHFKVVSYDGLGNMADYFLTDALSVEGWDIKNVYPLRLTPEWNDKTSEISAITQVQDIVSGTVQPFFNATNNKGYWTNVKPLDCENDRVTWDINWCGDTVTSGAPLIREAFIPKVDRPNSDISGYHLDDTKKLRNTIAPYYSDGEYSYKEINDHFMRMLKINSRNIIAHKGTIEGVEMMLGLFGMKSKRFAELEESFYVKGEKSVPYDFSLTEDIVFTRGLKDKWNEEKSDFEISWYNSTKYNASEDMGMYEGLPVSCFSFYDKDWNLLYPYFNNEASYDNEIIYQSNGGWQMHSPIMFAKNNVVLRTPIENTNIREWTKLHKESVTKIHYAEKLIDLMSVNEDLLNDGDIYFVNNLLTDYIIIDGVPYDVEQELYGEEIHTYISVYVVNGSVTVGKTLFTTEVNVSNPYYSNNNYRHYLSEYPSGTEIRLYIVNRGTESEPNYTIEAYNEYTSINSFTFFTNENMFGLTSDDKEYETVTHYFRLNDVDFKNELSLEGWRQIRTSDEDYGFIDTISEYFKGNNPHVAHPEYDNGSKYLINFKRLFDYHLNEGIINMDCYSSSQDYEQAITNMASIGFNDIVGEDANDISALQCDYRYQTFSDTKVHYFGDLTVKIKNRQHNDCGNIEKWDYVRFPNEFPLSKNIKGYDIFVKSPRRMAPDSEQEYGEAFASYPVNDTDLTNNVAIAGRNGVQEQIINTKIVKLEFIIRNADVDTVGWINQIKYIDSVILPYVEQVIPSTSILKVSYANESK